MQPVIQTLEILAGTTGYLMRSPDEVLRKVAGNDAILKVNFVPFESFQFIWKYIADELIFKFTYNVTIILQSNGFG